MVFIAKFNIVISLILDYMPINEYFGIEFGLFPLIEIHMSHMPHDQSQNAKDYLQN